MSDSHYSDEYHMFFDLHYQAMNCYNTKRQIQKPFRKSNFVYMLKPWETIGPDGWVHYIGRPSRPSSIDGWEGGHVVVEQD